jgi:hypothetical protein
MKETPAKRLQTRQGYEKANEDSFWAAPGRSPSRCWPQASRARPRDAGIDPTTLSRMESADTQPVGGATRNLQAVLDVLAKHGVEIAEDSIRLTGKAKRR